MKRFHVCSDSNFQCMCSLPIAQCNIKNRLDENNMFNFETAAGIEINKETR